MIDPRQPSPAPDLFDLEVGLPDPHFGQIAERLVGFTERYERLRSQLALVADPGRLYDWSLRWYGQRIPLLDVVLDVAPLALFWGDVGCGKTATAKAVANQLAIDLGQDGVFRSLSTRVRGTGELGEMTGLINDAFDEVITSSKRGLSFLLIDEADSLGETRSETQSHHEDRVGVNSLLQRLDELVQTRRRVLVFLATNRITALDSALLRRAQYIEAFERPSYEERLALLRADLTGTGLPDFALRAAARLTGAVDGRATGFTYSDLRHRLLRRVLAAAVPDRPIRPSDLITSAGELDPSPPMHDAPLVGGP